jgi:hypothetical protein
VPLPSISIQPYHVVLIFFASERPKLFIYRGRYIMAYTTDVRYCDPMICAIEPINTTHHLIGFMPHITKPYFMPCLDARNNAELFKIIDKLRMSHARKRALYAQFQYVSSAELITKTKKEMSLVLHTVFRRARLYTAVENIIMAFLGEST